MGSTTFTRSLFLSCAGLPHCCRLGYVNPGSWGEARIALVQLMREPNTTLVEVYMRTRILHLQYVPYMYIPLQSPTPFRIFLINVRAKEPNIRYNAGGRRSPDSVGIG